MGGKTATSTSQTTIPPEVLARYNAVNTMAEGAASKPYQSFGTQASDYIAQMNQQQGAGINRVNAAAGSYQPYLDAATGATRAGMGSSIDNIQKYMSPYLTNVADTTSALMRQSNEQAQSGALGAAASSGAFGGDRAGIAAANLAGQNQLAMGKTMADIYNQGYGQAASLSQADLARQLQGGAQMAGLGAQAQGLGLQGAQAQLAAGTMQQQTEQAGKDAMINRFMQEQGYPFQTAQFLANIALGTGVASGTTTTAERPVGFFQNLASGGRANGYADGGGVAGPMQHSQSGVGSQGYVPAGVLPVGDLMISQLPQEEQRSGLEDVMKIASMFMGGKAHGGAAVGRHGYADGGSPIPGARNENLPSGLVPQNNELRRPFSYSMGEKPPFSSDLETDKFTVNDVLGLVKNKDTGQYVSNERVAERAPDGRLVVRENRNRDDALNLFPYNLSSLRDGRSGISSQRNYASKKAIGLQPDVPVEQVPSGLSTAGSTSVTLPNTSGVVPGMEAPPAFPDAGLAPTTSLRPAPRPVDTAGAPTAVDLAAAGIGAIPVVDTAAYGVGAPSVPDVRPAVSTSPRADTGERLEGGYTPIVPLTTQLNFTLHELGKPEYNSYLQGNFRTPSEAAVAFDRIYERSGGAGNKAAASYAEGIHAAAMSGDMSGLPPNVVTAYNHFVENGMDPIQAAGAVGRFMVESYPSLNTNARNTMGGGNGTYGIAQWRGSRMEELAEFAGVPLDALTGAPVSTPEGRYYSTGVAGGDGVSGVAGGAGQTQAQPGGLGGPRKAYEDRNALGQFLRTPDGRLNKDAIMSILSGLGTMASSTSMSPLTALLQGAGAGAATYSNLEQRAADIGLKRAQTTTEAVQLLKNSIYYDANLGMSVIPLAGGGQQSLADFVVNPAGPSMAGPAMDAIIRSIAGGANSRGVDLTTATPEQIFSGASLPTGQETTTEAPAAGMPVTPVVTPYESFGTFPLGDLEQAYIAQAEARARSGNITAPEREASIARSEASRAAADAGTASASLAFRNTNELAATVAKAAAENDLGPLGNVKAAYENLASQVAGMVGVQYDGTAASSQALLEKLSTLSADQMTADTAAASLYLQNKSIFPDISMNPTAAAEITAEMLTKNMFSYEKGQYINDLYRAQRGAVKDLTGADALFNKKAGNIYQGEKANIAELLKYAGNAEADPEVKQLVVDFFDSANKGYFKDQADAQAALEAIFTILPGQHSVSSGLGRYFVQ